MPILVLRAADGTTARVPAEVAPAWVFRRGRLYERHPLADWRKRAVAYNEATVMDVSSTPELNEQIEYRDVVPVLEP